MLDSLIAPFLGFVEELERGRPVAILCHSDCDGLAAGVILAKSLERAGHTVAVEATGKGESAWSPGAVQRIASHDPQALIVADLGCRPEPVLPGVPTLFLDHHRPDGLPGGAILITGYGVDPTPTSGLLAWLCGSLIADVADLKWIAAISLLSDLGDSAPFPILAEVRQQVKVTPLRNATSLLNAARRSSSGDASPALSLLRKASSPKEVVSGGHGETRILKAMKAEVSAAFAAAKRLAPHFSITSNVALVQVHSPCQIHPLVVQIWRTRLKQYIVIASNTGYLPGRVNFSVRSATGVNLLDFLARHAPADPGPDYGRGHDQATGGSLSYAQWDDFIARVGFPSLVVQAARLPNSSMPGM